LRLFDGLLQGDGLAVDKESRAERERAPAATAVFELDVAGLDARDGAAPAVSRDLDHEIDLCRNRLRHLFSDRAPVARKHVGSIPVFKHLVQSTCIPNAPIYSFVAAYP